MTTLATLADLRVHLNVPTADTSHDTEIQGFLNAATAVVENITGPINIVPTVTEYHSGGNGFRSSITLRQRPVVSITSVTEYAGIVPQVLVQAATPAAATAYSYTLEIETGTLTRRVAPGNTAPFAWGEQNILVVYSAGYATVPDAVRLAALFQAAHLYQSSQLGMRASYGGTTDDGYATGTGYAIPNRVRELLNPYVRLPGLA